MDKPTEGKLKVTVQLSTGLLAGTMDAEDERRVHHRWLAALLSDNNDLIDFWMLTDGRRVFYSAPANDIEIIQVEREDSNG